MLFSIYINYKNLYYITLITFMMLVVKKILLIIQEGVGKKL